MSTSSRSTKSPGETLGKAVRNARIKKNLTQSECASRCGIGRRHIQKIEAGEVNPPLSLFQTLGSVLDSRACYFLNSDALESPLSAHGIACVSEVLDLMPTPVFVTSLNGDIIYKNASFLKLIGAERVSIWDILSRESDRIHITELLFSKSAKNKLSITGRYPILWTNGHSVPCQISWKLLNDPGSNEVSAVLGVLVPLEDPVQA